MSETSTAVQAAPEATLAEWQAVAWESDGTEEIAPSFPVVKIVQISSAMKGSDKHLGEFWRSDTEEYLPFLNTVALFQKDTRAYFVEGNDQPRCMSADGIKPLPNMPVWTDMQRGQPANCDTCPFSAWRDDKPPLCKSSLVVLADLGGELVQLRIAGTAIKPWRQFIAKRLKPKKLPLCSQRLTLSTEVKTEPGKKWAQLRIESELLSPTEASIYNAVVAYERKRFEEAVRESHEPVDDDSTPARDPWPAGVMVDADGVVTEGEARPVEAEVAVSASEIAAEDAGASDPSASLPPDEDIIGWANDLLSAAQSSGLTTADLAKVLGRQFRPQVALDYCRSQGITASEFLARAEARKPA